MSEGTLHGKRREHVGRNCFCLHFLVCFSLHFIYFLSFNPSTNQICRQRKLFLFIPAWVTSYISVFIPTQMTTNIYEIRCIHEIELTFIFMFFSSFLLKVLLEHIRQIFLRNVDSLDFHRYVVKLKVWILIYSTWGQLTVITIKV